MNIETVYDEDTQKLIDFYNNEIAEIAEEYKNIMKSAKEITYYEHHGGIKKLKEEFEQRVEPYRKRLLEIYLTARPTYIIKKGDK